MHKYNFRILGQSHERVAHAMDAISLQSINNRYFTIDSEDSTRPTYVEILTTNPEVIGSSIKVLIRTKREPIQGNKNLESGLQTILDELDAKDF